MAEPPVSPPGLNYNEYRKWRTNSGIRGTSKDISESWRVYSTSTTSTTSTILVPATKRTPSEGVDCNGELTQEEILDGLDRIEFPRVSSRSPNHAMGVRVLVSILMKYYPHISLLISKDAVDIDVKSLTNDFNEAILTHRGDGKTIRTYLEDIIRKYAGRVEHIVLAPKTWLAVRMLRVSCEDHVLRLRGEAKEMLLQYGLNAFKIMSASMKGWLRIKPIIEAVIRGTRPITVLPKRIPKASKNAHRTCAMNIAWITCSPTLAAASDVLTKYLPDEGNRVSNEWAASLRALYVLQAKTLNDVYTQM